MAGGATEATEARRRIDVRQGLVNSIHQRAEALNDDLKKAFKMKLITEVTVRKRHDLVEYPVVVVEVLESLSPEEVDYE